MALALRSLDSEWSVWLIELMHMSLVGSKAKALDQKETIDYMKAIDQTYDLHIQSAPRFVTIADRASYDADEHRRG